MTATRARNVLVAAVAAVIAAGVVTPAFAEPTEFCVGLTNDRRALCVTTEWLPTATPVSPQ